MRGTGYLIVALSVGACSRQFPPVPVITLTVEPAFANVAPREVRLLGIDGGEGVVSFAFQGGAAGSGSDAVLDAGYYQAGAEGSTQDVVLVTDAAGQMASATFSVGPRLSEGPGPENGQVSPLGTFQFMPTGGKPPYTFALSGCGVDGGSQPDAGSGGSIDAAGHYLAGATGNTFDCILIGDATRDPLATTTAQVYVGDGLSISPQFAQVAPRGKLTLRVFGGTGDNRFAFQHDDAGSGLGASIDDRGDYQAGAAGSTQDVVVVTDSTGDTAQATLAVGPALAFRQLPTGSVPPDSPFQFQATGGQPPYAYALHGCEADGGGGAEGSGGHIAADTGAYLAGDAGNTFDCIVASDATADPLAVAIAVVHVGSGLVVAPAFAQAAPRGKVSLAVSGGSGVYSFAFASTESGNPTIDDLGHYQAGASGPGQDVIAVTDSVGDPPVDAVIAVGSPVGVTPLLVALAPLGRTQFAATGGQPPYTFSVGCVGSDAGVVGTVGSDGLYTAGASGGVADCVDVSDATRDPQAVAHASVEISAALLLLAPGQAHGAPGSLATVAPGSSIAFIGVGGQPPYGFSVASPGGSTIDPHDGQYVASISGSTTDTVTVTDANQAQYSLQVPIGAALALSVQRGESHPGVALQLLASGGHAPYVYGFAAKGNHSLGTVDAASGVYTPGINYGAIDVLQVTDATGQATAQAVAPAVGPLQAPYGGVDRVLAADLNGDGVADVVVAGLANWVAGGPIVSMISQPHAAPLVTVGYGIVGDLLGDVLTVDINGDGHDDVVAFSGNTVAVLAGGFDGTLGVPQVVFQRASTTNGDGDGSEGFAVGIDPATGGPVVLTYEPDNGACGGDADGGNAGIVELDFAPGSFAPSRISCLELIPAWPLQALSVGDFNGDQALDRAWVDSSGDNAVHLDYGAPNGGTAPPSQAVPLPTDAGVFGSLYGGFGSYSSTQILPVLTAPGGDNLVAFMSSSSAVMIQGGATPLLGPVTSVASSSQGTAEDLAAVAISTPGVDDSLVACNGYDGTLPIFQPASGGVLAPFGPPPVFATQIDGVASPDFNGDGVPDLAFTAGGIAATTFVWGEGDGTYGRHARFAVSGVVGISDIDGDGIGDVVTNAERGVRVLYGGDHQLAYGLVTELVIPPAAVIVGDFDGVGLPDLAVMGNAGDLQLYLGTDGGTFADPVEVLEPDGGEFPLVAIPRLGDFGGAAPGEDLWVLEGPQFSFYPGVYVRDDAQHAHLASFPTLVVPYLECVGEAADLNGDGLDDLLLACDDLDGVTPNAILVGTATDGGSHLSFQDWADGGLADEAGTLPSIVTAPGGAVVLTSSPDGGSRLWPFGAVAGMPLDLPYRLLRGGTTGAFGPAGETRLAWSAADGEVHFFVAADGGGIVEVGSALPAAGKVLAGIAPVAGAPDDLVMTVGSDLVVHARVDGGFD